VGKPIDFGFWRGDRKLSAAASSSIRLATIGEAFHILIDNSS